MGLVCSTFSVVSFTTYSGCSFRSDTSVTLLGVFGILFVSLGVFVYCVLVQSCGFFELEFFVLTRSFRRFAYLE